MTRESPTARRTRTASVCVIPSRLWLFTSRIRMPTCSRLSLAAAPLELTCLKTNQRKGRPPPGPVNLRALGVEGSGLAPVIDPESPLVRSGLAPPGGRWWGRCRLGGSFQVGSDTQRSALTRQYPLLPSADMTPRTGSAHSTPPPYHNH
ncbi:hypothetical protein EYF80_029250 [Liparis tanakae]|uniref:Uncharacterized protein n=1 Tax=Liparis tanakae TaxID=230148 RepID=A0A4Z2H3T7_9TELE|nr:hypothetical protein EYF80_029250 [Liparis tanakae]